MRTHSIYALAALSLVGCDMLKKNKDSAGDASAQAPVDAAASAANKAAAAPTKGDGRAIDGVGDVPAWAPDKPTPKCAVSADARAKMKPLEKGDDAALAAGTADVQALEKSTGADTCFATRKALAQALNDGGFHKYSGKRFDEANRYWRAALTVRPGVAISRYNLACGLALGGKPKDAVAEIDELARAARDGDASAANFLEKAKSDDDLKTVRDEAAFKKALEASNAGLVGPRKEPETAARAIALLPEDFRKVKDEISGNGGFLTYKPAAQGFWTWRPNATTELLVATIIDDPAKVGKPKGDLNQDYGAIAVFKRDGDKLKLIMARKTGELPPAVASGRGGAVVYSFEQVCGSLHGLLTWTGQVVEVHEKSCQDL